MRTFTILGLILFLQNVAFSQLSVRVKGGDFEVCSGDSIVLEAEIISGSPISLSWISSTGSFTNSDSSKTKAIFTGSGNVILMASDGVNTTYDTVDITLNVLPVVHLKRRVFCQDIIELQLKEMLVISPATFLGVPEWNCLDCNGNSFDSMIVDKFNVGGITDYWLDISKNTYSMKNTKKDTIILELKYTNEHGCANNDTVELEIWKVPEISFSSMRDLCWDEGKISLNSLTKVTPDNGIWTVVDTTLIGFESSSSLGGITLDTINTRNTPKDTSESKKWILRYYHNFGCLATKDTVLTIHQIPEAEITPVNPNGCNPLTTEFKVQITNSFSPSSLSFNWDLGNGNTSNDTSPSCTFTQDGSSFVKLVLVSKSGCSNIIRSPINIYPIPQAYFTPDPNNYAPSSLPRFQFTNQSSVSNVLGTTISKNYWDFGESGKTSDTSTAVNPTYFYSSDTASYNVKLSVETNYGCKDSFSYRVYVGIQNVHINESLEDIHVNGGAELFPNPSKGQFKLGYLNPKNYNVYIFDKWGKFYGLLEANSDDLYTWNNKGIFLVIVEHKQTKERYNLRLLSL